MLVFELKIDNAPINKYKAGIVALTPTPKKRLAILEEVSKVLTKSIIENYSNGGAEFEAPFKPNSKRYLEEKDLYFSMDRNYDLPSPLDNSPYTQIFTGGTAYALITGEDTETAKGISEITPDLLRIGVELKYTPVNGEILIGFSQNSLKEIDKILQDYGRDSRPSSSSVPRGGK